MDDLKIRHKCEEMIAYGYVALRQFPKFERHVLAAEIRDAMWGVLRLIIVTNKRYHKKTTITEPVYDPDTGEKTGTQEVANPAIVADDAERADAQAVIDGIPQDVRDYADANV